MSDNIPLDIQAEIIKSLPVESLIRFRLVSKRWKSLIGSSKFIADYQKHKRHHHLLVRLKSSHNFDEKYVSIVDDDTFPQHKFSLTVPPSVKLLEKPDIVSSQGFLEADSARDFNLYNIRESLVMVQHKEAYVYSVWKMMEHGVAKSFTKLYTINPTDDVILDMYGFRTSGEPIVETKNNPQRDLFAYDPDSKHITYIGIPGSTRDFYPTVYSYTETLLLLDH
ncbi:putative F-box domain-containing protein [Tanacetum coccineum]